MPSQLSKNDDLWYDDEEEYESLMALGWNKEFYNFNEKVWNLTQTIVY